jgi:hypothetical protein
MRKKLYLKYYVGYHFQTTGVVLFVLPYCNKCERVIVY